MYATAKLTTPATLTPTAFLASTCESAVQLYPAIAPLSLFKIQSDTTPADAAPLFISVLLHGNETTGWEAIRSLFESYVQAGAALPRPILLLLGNTVAAAERRRHLDSQPDFNRIWPGTAQPLLPEAQQAKTIFDYVVRQQPLLHLDIHNNSGRNPLYSVIGQLDSTTLGLAQRFSNKALYFPTARGDATNAFSQFAGIPSITMECGRPGIDAHAEAAAAMVNEALNLKSRTDIAPVSRLSTLTLYETLASFHLSPLLDFAFNAVYSDQILQKTTLQISTLQTPTLQEPNQRFLHLRRDLDLLNFQNCAADTVIGHISGHGHEVLTHIQAKAPSGENITDALFYIDKGQLRSKTAFTPAMLTLDVRIARSDCLGYALKPFFV